MATTLPSTYRHNRKTDFWVSIGIALLAMIIGASGIYRVLVNHAHGALGSYVPWGLWVSVYVYLVWIEVGMVLSYFTLRHVFKVPGIDKLGPVVMLAAVAALLAALMIIGLDLGHPFRAFRAFYAPNFGSMMTWMIWLHTAYLLLLAVELWAYRVGKEGVGKVLSWIAVPAGVVLIAVIGGLFGVIAARPYWNATLLPLMFFISSIVAGAGLLTLLHLLFSPTAGTPAYRETASELARYFMWFIIIGLLAAAANLLVIAYPNVPANAEALRLALFGPYAWTIWIVHILIGTLVPLALLALARRSMLAIGIAAVLMVVTFIAVPLNIIIPGLAYPPPDLQGLAAAYWHPRLNYEYFPTATEWLVVVFAAGVALAVFALGYRLILDHYFKRVLGITR